MSLAKHDGRKTAKAEDVQGAVEVISADKKRVEARRQLPQLLCSLAMLPAVTVGAFSALVSATTIEETQVITSYGQPFRVNYEHISIRPDGVASSEVLVGQVIQFYNQSSGPSGKVSLRGISGEAEDSAIYSDVAGLLDTDLKPLKTGTYLATCAAGYENTTIIAEEPYLKPALKRSGKSIMSIPINATFTVELSVQEIEKLICGLLHTVSR